MGEYKHMSIVYRRNDEKDFLLKTERSITFFDVICAIEEWNMIVDIRHPNQSLYPWQKKMILLVHGYPHEIPYIQKWNEIFLKTIIPSRKYKKLLWL